MNEFLFLLHAFFISLIVLGAAQLGKEALVGVFCLQALIANLFVFKQISFLGLVITCTDAYTIGCYFSLGLLQHFYGEKMANQAISLCFYSLTFFSMASLIHLLYQPSKYDAYQSVYQTFLQTTPRVFFASLIASLTSQKLNIYIQRFLYQRLPKLSFSLLIAIPIIFSQLFDTVFFTFLALYTIAHSLWQIILISYVVKLLALALIIPLTTFCKKLHPATHP